MKRIDKLNKLAFSVGDVLLLNHEGTADADIAEMNRRCQSIIERECKSLKIKNPEIPDFCDIASGSEEVRDYFIRQIKEKIYESTPKNC